MELDKPTLKFRGEGKGPRKALALLDANYKIRIVIMTT